MESLENLKVDADAFEAARNAAAFLATQDHFNTEFDPPPVCIIPGSGWGNALKFEEKGGVDLHLIPGLEALTGLKQISGHEKKIKVGMMGGKPVVILSRIHGYQDPTPSKRLLRLSVEMLFHLGIREVISTSGVGSLIDPLMVGDVVAVHRFINSSSYPIPLFTGDDFASAEDGLSQELIQYAISRNAHLQARRARHAIVLGPQLESRTEKENMARDGGHVVGMSGQAAAAVARLYRGAGARFLMLALVTNDQYEEHSHQDVVKRGAEQAERLGRYLQDLVCHMPDHPGHVQYQDDLRSGQGELEYS